MSDKDDASTFTTRQSSCRTSPSGFTILDDPGSTAGAGKRQRESPCQIILAMRPQRESERCEIKDEQSEEVESTEQALHKASKEELLNRAHEAAIVVALNLRLAEVELATASAKLEAAEAGRMRGGEVGGGYQENPEERNGPDINATIGHGSA
ncbi:hypothetical protein EVAR_50086_1 [Eumeta japonica]|uniref:Uncharacterized protein n=1 Tax=Eumeta variegata TaxID=151549 RepID=A0A4C1XWW2_EUMVA|nr:hypothetical protein EVAR_50086_1 [Eumeta japonica]